MYKNSLPSLDGYLTEQGKINFSNCDVLFRDIAKYEEEFFRLEQGKIQREREFGPSYRGRGGRGGRGGFRGNQEKPNEPQKSEEQLLEEAKNELKQELEGLSEAEKTEKIKKSV